MKERKDLLTWIEKELNGYPRTEKTPGYRKMRGIVKAWNPFRGWVPVLFKDSEVEQTISTRGTSQSIPEMEELLKSESDTYEMPFPMSAVDKILAEGEPRTKMSLFIPRTALVNILNTVRNSLQDWLMTLNLGFAQSAESSVSVEKSATRKPDRESGTVYHIGNIETLQGNLGENNGNAGGIIKPTEGFWSKFFWYVIVALLVVIAGNVLSVLVLNMLNIPQ